MSAALTLLAVLLMVGPAPIGGRLAVFPVSGTSMEPTYFAGDLIVSLRAAAYEVGETIVFASGSGDVVHRIVGGDGEQGFVTRGDNRIADDPWNPTLDDIAGRPVLHVPAVGGWILRMQDALGPQGLMMLSLLTLGLAARSGGERRGRRQPWPVPVREAAVAGVGAALLGLATLRLSTAGTTLLAAPARLGVGLAVAGLLVLLGAAISGTWSGTRRKTARIDLALGRRVVDVDRLDLDVAHLAHLDDPAALRRTADVAGTPVLRERHPDGTATYAVFTPSSAVVLTVDGTRPDLPGSRPAPRTQPSSPRRAA